MKRHHLLLFVIVLAACSTHEMDIPLEPATNTLEPTSTFTTEPSDTPQPTDTVELFTATATYPPTLTPAFEIGSLMTNEIDGASMVYVPPGEFKMGDDSGSLVQQPAHLVSTLGFWMYQYEVTNAQFTQCVAAGVCETPGKNIWNTREKLPSEYFEDPQFSNFPVFYVSWESAAAYCEWAGGRLPTEAEWEMAARGGLEEMSYPWGNEDPVCDLGAVNGAHFSYCGDAFGGEAVPVGSYAPNGYGLYDMAGNVMEWVNDFYKEDYYELLIYENPQGPTSGGYRSVRGGGFNATPNLITVTARNYSMAGWAFHAFGFRCVVSP